MALDSKAGPHETSAGSEREIGVRRAAGEAHV
jgi:hypothetical protein